MAVKNAWVTWCDAPLVATVSTFQKKWTILIGLRRKLLNILMDRTGAQNKWGQKGKAVGKPGCLHLLFRKSQRGMNQSLTYSDSMPVLFHRTQSQNLQKGIRLLSSSQHHIHFAIHTKTSHSWYHRVHIVDMCSLQLWPKLILFSFVLLSSSMPWYCV